MEQLMEVDVHSLSAASVVASALASPLPFSTSFCSTACFVSSTCTKQVFTSLPLFMTLHFTPTLHDPSLVTLLYFTPTLHDPSHSFTSLPLFMTLHFTLHTPLLHSHSCVCHDKTFVATKDTCIILLQQKRFVVTKVVMTKHILS